MKIVLIGGGGHAKVVTDILLASPAMQPVGYTALAPAGDLLGVPFLGSDGIGTVPHDGVVVAVGDNQTRMDLYQTHVALGETLVSATHPSALIAPDVVIEPGCMICAGVVVNSGSIIRANTILNTGCTVDHDCEVGPHAHVAPGVNLAGNVSVGEGAFLGIGTSVIQGISIGAWSTAGAGTVIIRDVRPEATVVGVPARELPNPEF